MYIAVLALGSRGDVQPYIALAKGIEAAGDRVRFAAPSNFESFVRSYGLEYMPMGGNFRDFVDAESARRVLEKSNLLTYFRDFSAMITKEFLRFGEDAWAACQRVDAVVFSSLAVSGYSIAEKLGIPSAWAPLQPQSRTRAFPSAMITTRPLGGALNRFSHVVEEQLIWQPASRVANGWRKNTLGLKPYPWYGPYDYLDKIHYPKIYGYSPTVLPKPADWGEWLHVTGYWFLDRLPSWQPPQELVDFIASGPPPVYIGFGSMGNRKPEDMTRLVLRALELTRQRAVLGIGWGALKQIDLPKTVFPIDAVPHDWLFPLMAAVVHHGGAGTTAAAFRAGVPSVIVPFSVDQPFWAHRAHVLGAATAPIPRAQLTAERLAAALTTATTDRGMHARVEALGERIRAEDGVRRAVEALHEHFKRG